MNNSISENMQVTHSELTQDARNALTGQWGLAVVAYLVYTLLAGISALIPVLPFIIGGPLALGLSIFALRLARSEEADIGNIFDGFANFGNAFGTYVLMVIAVIAGIIFFIIPGIIIAFGLSQSMYILADNPKMAPLDVLKESWEMMKGNKLDYFVFMLRFIPWAILCIFTLMIGILWLMPYVQVSTANYYDALCYAQDRNMNDINDSL